MPFSRRRRTRHGLLPNFRFGSNIFRKPAENTGESEGFYVITEPTKTTDSEEKNQPETAQSILDFGSALTRTPHGAVYCLTIIGQIEGHTTAASNAKTTKYEHVLPLLAKLEESGEIDGILFLLNTVGGDVEAGLAIAELIAGMTKPTVSIVLGGSHSIGVPLAVAARRSFAVPSAAMTIHPVRMSGTVIAAPQTYHYFERLQERIVAFVSGHSQISAEDFQSLMLKKDDMAADVGSVIYGEEAVQLGLIDQVGGLSDGLQCLYRQIGEQKGKKA